MVAAQLTLEGHEEPVGRARTRADRGPRGAGLAILKAAVAQGGLISSTQAGLIRHMRRGTVCHRPNLPGALGCCHYCASDGADTLKTLAKRGLVERVSRGLWAVLEPGELPRPAPFRPGLDRQHRGGHVRRRP